MRTHLLIVAAATAALLAGAAFAQSAPSDTAVNPPSADAVPSTSATGEAVPNGPAPMTRSPDVTQPAMPSNGAAAPGDATVAPAAGAPAERAPAASVGGTDVVSNGPVPDTKENRAKYGRPMSNAGRMSKPAGN